MDKITALQAFNVMTCVLDAYYDQTHSDDVGSLLGDMSFLHDDGTADSAAWFDWMHAISSALVLTKDQAFNGMKKFLSNYADRTSSIDIKNLLAQIKQEDQASKMLQMWEVCLKKILKKDDSCQYLELSK